MSSEKANKEILFGQARSFLQPSSLFRLVTYLYAERKLVVFFLAHFVATMIIWGHFALVKFHEQENAVPEGANRYWLKRIVPTLEFGSMHAILFQMALLPLTMCRFTIAGLSESILNRIVPLNRALRMHIHLGYTMILIVFLATLFFFAFFGTLCADGEQAFCEKFKSEIMITGYVILGFLLFIGGTSYFRHWMPYEVFYAIHHLVFLLYIVTILHTVDNVQRNNGRNRSQTHSFLCRLYYLCDRAAMYLNHKYKTTLVSSSIVAGTNGSKMIILRLRKPVLFSFKPGQYAFIQFPGVDRHWHPFSIASGPRSSTLEFFIEVFDDNKSWTGKLFKSLEAHQSSGLGGEDVTEPLEFQIMGPYGTSLAKTQDYSHVLAVGSGTGIVPVLSLFQQHVDSLLQLNAVSYFEQRTESKHAAEEYQAAHDRLRGSAAHKLSTVRLCRPNRSSSAEDSTPATRRREMRQTIANLLAMADGTDHATAQRLPTRKTALAATRSIYGVVALSILPVLGLTVIGLTLSWNTLPLEFYDFMAPAIIAVTLIFRASFVFVACFVWNCVGLGPLLDVALGVLVAPVADGWWFRHYMTQGPLSPTHVTLAVLLASYQTARLWTRTVQPRGSQSLHDQRSNAVLEGMQLVWVTRSAAQAIRIVPQIDAVWQGLVKSWGIEHAMAVCPVRIHVTDPHRSEYKAMESALAHTGLFQQGAIVRGRPDLPQLLQDATTARMDNSISSRTLVAFCGSPELSGDLHRVKIESDMLVSMLGYKKHAMDFVSESYGGRKATGTSRETMADTEPDVADDDALPTMQVVEEVASEMETESENST